MLKFFFADWAGLCLLILLAGTGVLWFKQQWGYGALCLMAFVLYLAAVFIYGTMHK